ncbi:MAG: hypothetical protein R2911_22265 [Caldilineaceae bacterium]
MPGRIQKTGVLAMLAFVVVMPLALLLRHYCQDQRGAGGGSGHFHHRLGFDRHPEFVTGVVLILVFGIWLKWLRNRFWSSFSDQSILELLTSWDDARNIGTARHHVDRHRAGLRGARGLRTSMVEVMNSSYALQYHQGHAL